jgi:hypothetical protein
MLSAELLRYKQSILIILRMRDYAIGASFKLNDDYSSSVQLVGVDLANYLTHVGYRGLWFKI